MASTYSTDLRLELIGTGDQAGTWGNTTNTNLGTLIEQSIIGYTTVPITDGANTVITISDGLTSVARNHTLELTGALTANRILEVPAKKKTFVVYNNTTGGFSVTVKVNGQTGVVIKNGRKRYVYNTGVDVVEAINDLPASATVDGNAIGTASNPSFTGVALFGDGALSTPSISFISDTNTGIWRVGADQFSLTAGGISRLLISSTGADVTGALSVSTSITADTYTAVTSVFAPQVSGTTVTGTTGTFTNLTRAGTTVSIDGHTHDDRYFTETEVNANFVTYTYLSANYYTASTVNSQIVGYAFPLTGGTVSGTVTVSSGSSFVTTDGAVIGQRIGGASGVFGRLESGTGSLGIVTFQRNNVSVGSVSSTNTTTTYNTTSDGRLKENVDYLDGAGDVIDALKPCAFDWKLDGSRGYGIIAQEANEVVPTAIHTNDDGYMEADYSKFVPFLLAEVKALRKRIAVLEQGS